MVGRLVSMLQDSRLDEWAPGSIITEIRGLGAPPRVVPAAQSRRVCSGDRTSSKEAIIGPHLELIKSFGSNSHCVQLVQAFDDWLVMTLLPPSA
jgi:hypothetical protein